MSDADGNVRKVRRPHPGRAALPLLLALTLLTGGCTWIDRASVPLPAAPPSMPLTEHPDLSADGRFVTFQSDSPSIVPDDSNGAADVFVRDLRSRTTERVSVSSTGEQGNSSSFGPRLSADGRVVVFTSSAANLVAGDTDQSADVFVHDRATGETRRLSDATSTEAGSADISADGRWVVYEAGRYEPRLLQFPFVLRHDLLTGTTDTVSGGLGIGLVAALSPSVSDDGRFVAYTAGRPAGGPTGFAIPVAMVRDMAPTGSATLVADYAREGTISGDGRVLTYRVDQLDGTPTQVYVAELATGTVELITATPTGQPTALGGAQLDISADGRYVAFVSRSSDLVPIPFGDLAQAFVRDRTEQRTHLVSRDQLGSPADGFASSPSAVGGGYVAFVSPAANLAPGDSAGDYDVFVTVIEEPTVTAVLPGALVLGTTTTLVITGTGFRAPASVGIVGMQDVTFGSAVVVSATRIDVPVTVSLTAPPGPRVLVVTDLGTGPGPAAFAAGVCTCLTVSG